MARVSGLISGLDTDTLIQELVSAYSVKQQSYEKAQTKLGWTQEAWKSLNTKVYSFYSGKLSSARFSSTYNLKKAVASDTTKATVTASSDAVVGTQTLKVNSLAKTAYLTGGQLKSDDGTALTSNSKLSSLEGFDEGISGILKVTVDGKEQELSVNGDTTINGLVTSLKDAGLNANFDAANQRLFISAKTSGEEHSFTVIAGNAGGLLALSSLGLSAASESDMTAYENTAALYGYTASTGASDGSVAEAKILKDTENTYIDYVLSKKNTLLTGQINELAANNAEQQAKRQFATMSGENQTTQLNSMKEKIDTAQKELDGMNVSDENYADKQKALAEAQTKYDDYKAIQDQIYTIGTDEDGNATYTLKSEDAIDNAVKVFDDKIEENNKAIIDLRNVIIENNALAAESYDFTNRDESGNAFSKEISLLDDEGNTIKSTVTMTYDDLVSRINSYATEDQMNLAEKTDMKSGSSGLYMGTAYEAQKNAETEKKDTAIKMAQAANTYSTTSDETAKAEAAKTLGIDTTETGAVKVDGADAQITLNGAVFNSTTNNFAINGLTITATGLTNPDEEITINTTTDIDAMYDSIKSFLAEYNTLISNMSTLYNANSARGYEPLTDEEKDALTDTEVEKWEEKIKESLLRRDDTLSSIMNVMKNGMAKTYTIDGKNYALSSFGIKTSGYFAVDAEKQGVYHIDGDSEDTSTSGNKDKLRTALANDPDATIQFFQNLATDLYNTLTKKMQASSLSSAYTIYNDKQMATQYSDYDDIIDEWDDKIESYTERYIKQFTAMETAMSKLQSSTSQLSGLMG